MPVQGANCPDPKVFHPGISPGRAIPYGPGWHHRGMTTPQTPGPGTAVEERTDVRPDLDLRPEPGDSERFSHYVPKNKLMEALVNGTPVRALCGKIWTPSRDPKKYPVCPECKEIWQNLPPGDDGDNDPDR